MRCPAKLEASGDASPWRTDPKKDDQTAPTKEPLFGTDAMTDKLTEETRQRVHNSRVLLKKTEGIFLRRQKQSD